MAENNQLLQKTPEDISTANQRDLIEYQNRSVSAMRLVDDVVLKHYVTELSKLEIVPFSGNDSLEDIILFKINKMVYEKDEYSTDKFISVISAMTYTESSIFLIVDGHREFTDFYLGVKCEDSQRTSSSIAKSLEASLRGQFPGIKMNDYSIIEKGQEEPRQNAIMRRILKAESISSCVGIPSYKNSKEEYTNANFIQGIEKFAIAMQGHEYTAIVLASNIMATEISSIRKGYEDIYTELSAMATNQIAYSTNESLANAFSRTKGYSDAKGISVTNGMTETIGETDTHTEGTSHSKGHTEGESKENIWGKAGKIGASLAAVVGGIALTATGSGAAAGIPMIVGGVVGSLAGVAGTALAKNESKSDTTTEATNSSDSHAKTKSTAKSHNETTSDTHTEQFSQTDGTTSTIGSSKNFTITIQNKHIVEVQKRIDKQLERISLCESSGIWSTSAYVISYKERDIAEIGASIFRSIMLGEQSGVECSALNTWYSSENKRTFNELAKYVSTLSHPMFFYQNEILNRQMEVFPTSLLSSSELAMMIGLPRKSVPGLPVLEHISMGKEVTRLNARYDDQGADFAEMSDTSIAIGCIYDQGLFRKDNKVRLNAKSLTQHTFVTGSTGCGKSNTIYYLINKIRGLRNSPKFMIIEPAKGEYKDVFGNENVYGTNPIRTPMLRINPFRFPDGVHVLEHIDRLIEIFNVCWPMYAAMPAVLKEAILNAYEHCGWNLTSSENVYSKELFPTFADLMDELVSVVNNSAYSEEVKSNYQGSLITRVKSLTNGLCKEIFSSDELGDEKLFDENVIVDISRIGSQETKSLIMGILIMRLSEYRANSNITHNSELRHVTILEEAHNILKRCSQEQNMEGSNVAGKSVEMISNAIAEMRTFGEGFIIVDQSPGAVDISAIRNTNTKIIMRLPEENDRQSAGKAAGMKDEQIDEIAKLPTGVAVVYQNDWEEPVLCKIGKYSEEEIPFVYNPNLKAQISKESLSGAEIEVLKFLLQGRLSTQLEFDPDKIGEALKILPISSRNKMEIYYSLSEYRETGKTSLWENDNFVHLSRLIAQVLSLKTEVKRLANSVKSFDELNEKLASLITSKVEEMPNKLIAVTSQCLMRDFSIEGETALSIYDAWYKHVKSTK